MQEHKDATSGGDPMGGRLSEGELREQIFNTIHNARRDADLGGKRMIGDYVEQVLALLRKEKSALLERVEAELPEDKKLFIGNCPLKGACDGPRCVYEHELGYQYYNQALGDIRTILQSHKQQVEGEEL